MSLWKLDDVAYEASLSLTGLSASPLAGCLSADGTKFFVIGASSAYINKYTLGTAFNVSTGTLSVDTYNSLNYASSDLSISTDGTKLYRVCYADDNIHQYTMGTAFALASISGTVTKSVYAQTGNPFGLTFSSDGTKAFVATNAGTIYRYDLSTAWSIASAAYVSSGSISTQVGTTLLSIDISSDGTSLIALTSGNVIYEYDLGTAYDLSTLSYTTRSFSITAQTTNAGNVRYASNGTRMYVVSQYPYAVHQYALGVGSWEVFADASETFSVSAAVSFELSMAAMEQLIAGSMTSASAVYSAMDALGLTSASAANPIYALRERLNLQDAPAVSVVVAALAAEQMSLQDSIRYIATALASDGFSLTADTTYTTTAILFAAELLAVSSSTSTTLEIAETLTEILSALDAATFVENLTAEETVSFADALTTQIRARFTAGETLALADSIGYALTVICDELVGLSEDAAPNLILQLLAEERIAFIGKLPLEDGDYSAWVMNAETTGTTSYSNFPFNSLFTHEGVTYGITETGWYKLEGDDDDGTPIDAMLRTGDINFGTSRDKNVPRAYLYVLSDGNLVLKTVSSRFGSRTERPYVLALRDSTDDEGLRRVRLARGLRGTAWSFEIHNVDGSSLDFEGAEVLPVVLSRRG